MEMCGPYHTGIRRIVRFMLRPGLLLCMLFFLQYGCAPKIYTFNLLQPSDLKKPIEVKADSIDIKGSDGTTMVRALQLTFPGKVLDAAYDPDSGYVVAKYSTKKDTSKTPEMGRFVSYDIRNGNIKWVGNSNAKIEYIGRNMTTLKYKDEAKVYRVNNRGDEVSVVKPGFTYFDDDTVLCINNKKISRVDLYSGMDYWDTTGANSEEYHWPLRDGGWAYFISDGLHGIKLSDGSGWYLKAPTRRTSYGQAIATLGGALVVLNILTAPLGIIWIPIGIPRGPITQDMCSLPHIDGDTIYFAAGNDIFGLDKMTGDTIWQTKLGKDFEFEKETIVLDEGTGYKKHPKAPNKYGFMGIWDAGSNIALVGFGYKFIQSRSPFYFNPIDNALYGYKENLVKDTDPPFIDIIDRNTGAILSQTALEEKNWVMDFLWTPSDIYLLTPKHLYRFNNNLELVGTVDADSADGQYLSFLPSGTSNLIIRTENAVIALDNSKLESAWKVDMPIYNLTQTRRGTSRKTIEGNACALISAGNSISKSTSITSDRIWVEHASGRYLIDTKNNGNVVMEIPARSVLTKKGFSYWFSGKNLVVYKEPEW